MPTRLLATALTLAALTLAAPGACAQSSAARLSTDPTERPARTLTSFTPALRCMDDLLFRHGTRDVTLMMEELRDATQKLPLGARDMMASAVSDMTRRSRAVTLSVFGNDQQNLAQLLQQAQKTSPFAVVPEFALRGSLSQLDEDVRKDGASLGLLGRLFGLRLGSETRLSTIGLDTAVARTDSFALVSGVSSRNTAVIVRRDASAGDGEARLLGGSAVFAFQSSRADGSAQAVRNMIELAAIELVGKLTRTPYWTCLGVADEDPEVQRETEDWFLAMDEGERTAFLKERLRERRWFDGALDERPDPAFVQALRAYQAAMRPPAPEAIDLAFFRRFISEPVARGPLAAPRPRSAANPTSAAPGATSAAAPPEPAGKGSAPANVNASAPAEPAAAPAPFALQLQPAARGVQLALTVQEAGYAYCYAQEPASGRIRRIFPNRFTRDPRVEAGARLMLPGAGRFVLAAQARYACLHAPREVYGELPPPLRWGDFEDIRLPSFEAIRQQFSEAAGLPVRLVPAGAP